MKILIIGSASTSKTPEEYYNAYKDFFTHSMEAVGENAEIYSVLFDDLYIEVGDGKMQIYDTKNAIDLADVDYILLRGMGFRHYFDVLRAISVYAKRHRVQVVNDYSSFRDSSKLSQAINFYEMQLPVASTVYVNRATLKGHHSLPFTFPCIMKSTFGSHGNDNYVVQSLHEAVAIKEKTPDIEYVFQRLVPNDNDFRILVIGHEFMIIARKAVAGSHLNNTSKGGSAYLVDTSDVPVQMLKDAQSIAHYLGMAFAGVDALIDTQTGDYSFLEVNSQPQLMSGAFMQQKREIVGRYFMSGMASDS